MFYTFNSVCSSTAVLSFNVIVVSVVLWYWTHTQKLQAMSLNDRSEGRQSKRSSPIKVIDIKYYKHILIIIYSFLFLGKNLEDFLKEKHVSSKTGGALYYMWMFPSKVMPYLLRLAAPLTDSSTVHWDGDIIALKNMVVMPCDLANIDGISVDWLKNTRMPTESICYLYWKASK